MPPETFVCSKNVLKSFGNRTPARSGPDPLEELKSATRISLSTTIMREFQHETWSRTKPAWTGCKRSMTAAVAYIEPRGNCARLRLVR